MTPRDSRVGTRAPGRQQAPLRASLLPGSWWRRRGRVPIRRGALSPPAPQCDWSTEPQSAGEAARPRALGSPTVGAEDTKGDRSGKTRLLTWVIRWAHVWCWRLRPWKPGVAQTDQRPGALLILKRLIQLSETGGTHPREQLLSALFCSPVSKGWAKRSPGLPASSSSPACLGDGAVGL